MGYSPTASENMYQNAQAALYHYIIIADSGLLAVFEHHWTMPGMTHNGQYTAPWQWQEWSDCHKVKLEPLTSCKTFREMLTKLQKMTEDATEYFAKTKSWPKAITRAMGAKDPTA